MKVYFGHSSDIDYKELYKIIRESNTKHEIILPHEHSKEPFSSKDFLKGCDLFIAEVSKPSTGLGMELAWAKDMDVPVIFMLKKGSKHSDCLKLISDKFVEYENDFIEKLESNLQ